MPFPGYIGSDWFSRNTQFTRAERGRALESHHPNLAVNGVVEEVSESIASHDVPSILLRKAWYLLLLIPVIFFVISLHIKPTINADSGTGFIVLRSMQQGGAFNYVTQPDPTNIANDIVTFQSSWSPGQYLVPAVFIWFGADYQLAASLTTLLATIIGLIGWAQVAKRFVVTPFVVIAFLFGLVSSRYFANFFQSYHGGEVLLFAVAPWCLYLLRTAIDKLPVACFVISLLSAALLFLAKLTGLIIFAADVVAISLLELLRQRRVTYSMLALWSASGFAALSFLVFWHARGSVAADLSEIAVTWPGIWLPVAAAAFSGVSGVDLLNWFFHEESAWAPILSELATKAYLVAPFGLLLMFWAWHRLENARKQILIIGLIGLFTFFCIGLLLVYIYRQPNSTIHTTLRDAGITVLGLFGLMLMIWVWYRLRGTQYRAMAVYLLVIVGFYTTAFVVMYVGGSSISIEERHLRYAGILFFLLFLVALDQSRSWAVSGLTLMVLCIFAVYGLVFYAVNAHELQRGRYYETLSFTRLELIPPSVLEYLRSQMAEHNWQNAIAVIPSPEAAIGLPRFRIEVFLLDYMSREDILHTKLAGRAEKVFVIVQERMVDNGEAAAVLKSFVDYEEDKWSQVRIDGMAVYSQ